MEHTSSIAIRRRDHVLARAAAAALCETLERRTLYAGDPSDQVHDIYGTPGDDVINVYQTVMSNSHYVEWSVNGEQFQVNSTFYYYVNVFGGGGNDTLSVKYGDFGTSIHLHGGAGNDTMRFEGLLDAMYKAHGGDGNDKVVLDRTGYWDVEFEVDGPDVSWSGYNDWGNLYVTPTNEALEIIGTDGYDTFDVLKNPANRALTLRGGKGDDVFEAGAGNLTATSPGPLHIVGGEGVDDLVFDDRADTGNDSYEVGGTYLKKSGHAGVITFQSELVGVHANVGNNAIKAASATGALFQVFGGAGNDTFQVGGGDADKTIWGTLNVFGDTPDGATAGKYVDALQYLDNLEVIHVDIAYNATSIFRTNAQPLYHYHFDAVSIYGGSGRNKIAPWDGGTPMTRPITLDGGGDNDTLIGSAGNDTLAGGYEHDSLFGGAGNDLLIGGYGNDLMDGGANYDTVSYESRTQKVTVDLTTPGGDGGFGENDWSLAAEKFLLGKAGDAFIAGGTGVAVSAGLGNDTVTGGGGSDTIDSGGGVDSVVGSGGNDFISMYGSAGSVAKGGEGNDQIFVWSTAGLQVGGNGGNDFLNGGGGNDTVLGGSGNDQAFGGGGNDSINGESGNDYLEGNVGNDTVDGGSEDDTLYGHAGADLLLGGAGNDRLFANDGYGVDQVDGGDGIDEIFKEPYDTLLGS